MATDRPGAIGPAPEGSKRSGEQQGDGYFASRGMTKAEPQAGENSRRTPLPGQSRGRRPRTPARQAHHRTTGRTSRRQTHGRDHQATPRTRPRRRAPPEPGLTASSPHLLGVDQTRNRAFPAHRTPSPSSPAGSRPKAGRPPDLTELFPPPIEHANLATATWSAADSLARLPTRKPAPRRRPDPSGPGLRA